MCLTHGRFYILLLQKSDTADVSLPPTRKVLLGDKPPDKPTAAIKLDNLNNSGSDSANLLSTKDATTRDSHGSGYSGRDIENKLRQSDVSIAEVIVI